MTIDTTRKEFEEWIKPKGGKLNRNAERVGEPYSSQFTQLAYESYLEGKKKSEDTKRLERAFSLGMKIQTSFAVWSLVESEAEFRAAIATNQPKDKQ